MRSLGIDYMYMTIGLISFFLKENKCVVEGKEKIKWFYSSIDSIFPGK